MNKNLMACALALLAASCAFSQNVAWRRATGGFVEYGLAADSFNRICILSAFSGTHDFDPGPGDATITVNGPRRAVLQSYHADGTFRWARLHGSTNVDSSSCRLTLDPDGNAYVFGLFSQTADFDPGPGEYLLTTTAPYEAYLAKYDTLGALVWVKQLPGIYFFTGEVNGPHIDRDGNIYLAPIFTTITDADPGPGVFTITPNDWDAGVLKLDPDGNLLWAINVGSARKDRAVAVRTDAQKNVYLFGDMPDTGDFDPGPDSFLLTKGTGTDDAFLLKLDETGKFLWAKQLRCLQQYGKVYPIGLDVDAVGNAYLTGYYLTKMDLDPGPGTKIRTALGANDIFVVKLDPNGNMVYGHSIGTSNLDTGVGIAADAAGNVYVTGYFTAPIDVDPGPDTVIIGPGFGSYDGFVLSYDAGGNYRWARRFGGPDNDTGYRVVVDNQGRVFFINRMAQVYNLGYAPGEDFVVPTSEERIMIMQIDQENNYKGVVFRDLNGNQQRDAGEPGLTGVVIGANGQNLFTTTQDGGRYSLYHDFNEGDTLMPQPLQPYWTITPAFALTDSLNPTTDFAVRFPPDYRDAGAKAWAINTFRPGFNTHIKLQVTNLSSEAVDSILVTFGGFNGMPDFTIANIIPAPNVVTDSTLVWYTGMLDPGVSAEYTMVLNTSAGTPLGTPVDLVVTAAYPDDANPGDNSAHIVSEVIGAIDPNDKLVFPSEIQEPDLDSTLLYYTIRFQNTGNAPAEFVILRDTLLPELDPTSLRVLGASHPFSWRLHGENIFEVRFDGINLPDSTSNPDGSEGFVAFTLKPRSGLGVGDTVYNRAGIYFDYNAVVLTPWAKAAVVQQSASVSEPSGVRGALELYPNPSYNQCIVSTRGKLSGPGELLLVDVSGKICLQKPVIDVHEPFVLNGLPAAGWYVVHVRTREGFMRGLLIVGK